MTVAYRFGRFEVRPATRQLLVDGQPASLGARAFDLLLALIERRDRLVGKDEMLDLVWPGLVVEENNLQVQVSALRKVLGAEAIATVSGHGYRFTLQPTEVAAPPAAAAAKHNLPAPVASFIGRARELTELRAMLSCHRCVTLIGIGGIGKTRLALELAGTVVDAYADGTWFVDLAPVSEGLRVANAVASALGLREEPGQPVRETLLKFVRERTILLLLDNCEHVLPACAQLTRDLLQAGQKLTVVATSREPLHVTGEATFPLPPLATPNPQAFTLDALREYAAVELFVDRAIAVHRNFALTGQNATAVARICHDLDGIPLAIELAAARVRAMSAEVIADHLTDRFRLLKSGDVTALPRQQTLRAAIDWSYELLNSAERILLHRLSVFAGGFAVDGAEAVGTGGEVAATDVLELLANLVDKSLVGFDVQSERYQLLETVRQYAQERLVASGEEAAVRDAHLAFHAALAERAAPHLAGNKQVSWRLRLDAERENIKLAFAHAQAAPGGGPTGLAMVHSLFSWQVTNDLDLWFRVVVDALAHPVAQQEDLARCRALYVAAFLGYLTGRYDEAFALGQSSVRIGRGCDDPFALGQALYRSSVAAIPLGRLAEAREYLVEGLALARQTGDPMLMLSMAATLGELHAQLDEFELAETAYLEGLAHSRDYPQDYAISLFNLTRNSVALGDEAKATRYLREAVAAEDGVSTIQSTQCILMTSVQLAALRKEWMFALRLGGTADSYRVRHGLLGEYVDARYHERSMAAAREAVGAVAADAELAAGRTADVEAVIQEAKSWLRSLPN
ncbi:MAG: winged helix-turn-helix domain-containing protein [Casimicrobiaceae bacterium]